MRLHELFEASGWTAAKVKDEIKQDISYGSSGDVHPYFRRLDQDKAAVTALKFLNQNKTLSHALSMAYQEQGMSAIDSDARTKIYGEPKPKKGTGKGKKCMDCGGTGKKGVNTCGTCGGLGIIPGTAVSKSTTKSNDDEDNAEGPGRGKYTKYKDGTDRKRSGSGFIDDVVDRVQNHVVGGSAIKDKGSDTFKFDLDAKELAKRSKLNKN